MLVETIKNVLNFKSSSTILMKLSGTTWKIREELIDEQIAAMEKMFVQTSEVTDYNESLLNQLIALQ